MWPWGVGLAVWLGCLLPAVAQTSLHPSVSVETYVSIPEQPVRIARDSANGLLHVLTMAGNLYELRTSPSGTAFPQQIYDADDHGTPNPIGMAFDAEGTLYLVGNDAIDDDHTVALVRRGVRASDTGPERTWTTVMQTAPYRLSHTWFDHRFNGIAVSPNGEDLYLASGSRTDHGEMYDGLREEGLTAAIFRIPADADSLELPNDRAALRAAGYVFAEGTRNHFDLAFAPNGDLFGTENAGDRDDSEELNWLREGHHYGFPWRIGTSMTPQQFTPYDPESDPFVQPDRNTDNQADTGWYFSDDPAYPAPPDGVTFTDPIPNLGPDADRFRDPATGEVKDAGDLGVSVGTFTAHRAPLGLVFDQDSLLAEPFRGGAFVLSWNAASDQLLQRMNGSGEDLLFLDLDKTGDNYTLHATRIAAEFNRPIDAAMIENVIYVAEYDPPYNVYAVTLPRQTVDVDGRSEMPDLPALAAAYPNPFRTDVTFSYTVPRTAAVELAVFDVLGREVARLVDGAVQAAGAQEVSFSGDGLPGGIYVARLVVEGWMQTQTVVRLP